MADLNQDVKYKIAYRDSLTSKVEMIKGGLSWEAAVEAKEAAESGGKYDQKAGAIELSKDRNHGRPGAEKPKKAEKAEKASKSED